jgi:hypothetical protein
MQIFLENPVLPDHPNDEELDEIFDHHGWSVKNLATLINNEELLVQPPSSNGSTVS